MNRNPLGAAIVCSVLGLALLSRGRVGPRKAPLLDARVGKPSLYALLQIRPDPVVLATSEDEKELEREIAEMNQTWNHPELRIDRHRFVIQKIQVHL